MSVASSSRNGLSLMPKGMLGRANKANGSIALPAARLHNAVRSASSSASTPQRPSQRQWSDAQSRPLDAVYRSPLRAQPLLLHPYAKNALALAQSRFYSTESSKGVAQRTSTSDQGQKQESESSSSSSSEQPDPDEPPPKATIRERLRFLTRRYGWWALGVYLLASAFDFSLCFLAIHMLGAEYIRELENRVRAHLGMGSREMEDAEVAAWPVPVPAEAVDKLSKDGLTNNEAAAREALERVEASKASGSKKSSSQGSLWTEAVLAYTIHKTLLLPFRVGLTAAITPSFVKFMVRMGWARNNAAVQKAASKIKVKRSSSD